MVCFLFVNWLLVKYTYDDSSKYKLVHILLIFVEYYVTIIVLIGGFKYA